MNTTQQEEVTRWWEDGCDYTRGVMLFSRFSKNKTLSHTFMRKHPRFGLHKLKYELTKAVGLDWKTMPQPEKIIENQQPVPENDLLTTTIVNTDEKQPAIFSLNTPLVSGKSLQEYPKIIRRIKYVYAGLYRKRSGLHRQMSQVPAENTSGNVAVRSWLFTEIKKLSALMDYYYEFIWLYETDGKIPEEKDIDFSKAEKLASGKKENIGDSEEGNHMESDSVINDKEEPQEKEEAVREDLPALKRKKKNLQTANTKDKNMLLYGNKSRQQKENPMPEGPKRTKIEARIKMREAQIAAIEQNLLEPEN